VPRPEVSHAGTIEVICIDSGHTHAVPLAFVRTLDIPGIEADHLRETPPLATKYMLADVVAPNGRKSAYWSEPAMMFLKGKVENRDWKAEPMAMYEEYQVVRLFDVNNQLLVTLMIEQGLGVAAQTYHEAVSMCETMDKQPAFMKPAFNSFSAKGSVTNVDNTLPPSFAIPATYREHQPAFSMAANRSPKLSTASPVLSRKFVTNDIPSKGRHDVVVTPAFMKPAVNAVPDVISTSSGLFQILTVKVLTPKMQPDAEAAPKGRNFLKNKRRKANRKLKKLRSVVPSTSPDQIEKNEGKNKPLKRKYQPEDDDEVQESPNKKIKMDVWI
jgi:hypothetical protein